MVHGFELFSEYHRLSSEIKERSVVDENRNSFYAPFKYVIQSAATTDAFERRHEPPYYHRPERR